MFKFIYIFVLYLVFGAYCFAEKLNFVIFLADDCTYREIGAYSGVNANTPNIDNFASEGMLFERAYQATAMCSPTRHNLYTGLYPLKSGAYPNHTFAYDSVKSIVHYLGELDYDVALLGKNHVAPKSVFPFRILPTGKSGGINLSKAGEYMQKMSSDKQNFCLIVASHQPHHPYTLGNPENFPPESLILPDNMADTPETRSEYSKYLAEIEFMDNQFGTILKYIDELNLRENTVVVYLSEQGSAFPLAKWTCYEDGLKSAYIFRYPKMIQAGTKSQALVEYADVLPTFIELAGGEVPEIIDGKSIVENLKDSSKKGKKYSFSMQTTRGIHSGSEYYPIRSVTDGRYRYIYNIFPEATFKNLVTSSPAESKKFWDSWVSSSNTRTQKLVSLYQNRPQEELYDTQSDIYNLNNLAENKEYEQVKKELKDALFAHMKEMNDEGLQTEMLADKRLLSETKKASSKKKNK